MLRRMFSVPLIVAWSTGVAQAQAAQFTVTHDDLDGIVDPGQVVRIRHHMSRHHVFLVAQWAGDAVVTNPAGTVSGIRYMGDLPPVPYVQPGQIQGGGLAGVVFFHPPPGALGGFPTPPWIAGEVDFLEYEWTAPSEPGDYEFAWRESQAYPGVRGYQFSDPMNSVAVSATYLSTTLTVVPAPAIAAWFGASMAGLVMRRHRERC